MRRSVFFEIICIVFLAFFIAFVTAEEKTVTLTADEISQGVLEVVSQKDELQAFNSGRFKEQTGLNPKSFESWVYYGSEDVMNVRELIIIKVGDSDKTQIISALEKRREEKKNIFEAYSPEAYSLLKGSILKEKKGVIIYAVSEDADKALSHFLEIIK